MALDCQMILGNNEVKLLRYQADEGPLEWRTDQQWAVLRWSSRHLAPSTLQFIKQLPEQRKITTPRAKPIRVVHGSPRDPFEAIEPRTGSDSLRPVFEAITEPVLICAHTHLPWQVRRNGRLAVNPGAVCFPMNGDRGAQYAILDWDGFQWNVKHRSVRYDLSEIRRAFEVSGFLSEGGPLARAFLLDVLTSQTVSLNFLALAHRLAMRAGHVAGPLITDEIWQAADRAFAWSEYPVV
jgi:predicted phosphodiesterase